MHTQGTISVHVHNLALVHRTHYAICYSNCAPLPPGIYRLCKYFHGSHHLEEIIVRENIPRSQLLTLIDKFSKVLVPCSLPEQSHI